MTAIATPEERIVELMTLRDRIDAELDRLFPMGARRRRSRHELPACGTESGYQRHRYYGERCEDCRAAHAAHERAKAIVRRARKAVQ